MATNTRWAGPWHVIDSTRGDGRDSVESHETEADAERARDVLNAHERGCTRGIKDRPRYAVEYREGVHRG